MLRVYKELFSERLAYRYRVTDEAGEVRYIVEPTGLFLPNPSRLITLFDADHRPVGRIDPPETSYWSLGGTYRVFLEGQEKPALVVTEQWEMVDLLLLRLPRYVFTWENARYIARGSQYGERYYEIFLYPSESELRPMEGVEEGAPVAISPVDLDVGPLQEIAEQEAGRWGEAVGAILRPIRGPNYLVEGKAGLATAYLPLTVLVVLADVHRMES